MSTPQDKIKVLRQPEPVQRDATDIRSTPAPERSFLGGVLQGLGGYLDFAKYAPREYVRQVIEMLPEDIRSKIPLQSQIPTIEEAREQDFRRNIEAKIPYSSQFPARSEERETEVDRLFGIYKEGGDVLAPTETSILERILPTEIKKSLYEQSQLPLNKPIVGAAKVFYGEGHPGEMFEGPLKAAHLAKIVPMLVKKSDDVADVILAVKNGRLDGTQAINKLSDLIGEPVNSDVFNNLKVLHQHGHSLTDIKKTTGVAWRYGDNALTFTAIDTEGNAAFLVPQSDGKWFLGYKGDYHGDFTLENVGEILDEFNFGTGAKPKLTELTAEALEETTDLTWKHSTIPGMEDSLITSTDNTTISVVPTLDGSGYYVHQWGKMTQLAKSLDEVQKLIENSIDFPMVPATLNKITGQNWKKHPLSDIQYHSYTTTLPDGTKASLIPLQSGNYELVFESTNVQPIVVRGEDEVADALADFTYGVKVIDKMELPAATKLSDLDLSAKTGLPFIKSAKVDGAFVAPIVVNGQKIDDVIVTKTKYNTFLAVSEEGFHADVNTVEELIGEVNKYKTKLEGGAEIVKPKSEVMIDALNYETNDAFGFTNELFGTKHTNLALTQTKEGNTISVLRDNTTGKYTLTYDQDTKAYNTLGAVIEEINSGFPSFTPYNFTTASLSAKTGLKFEDSFLLPDVKYATIGKDPNKDGPTFINIKKNADDTYTIYTNEEKGLFLHLESLEDAVDRIVDYKESIPFPITNKPFSLGKFDKAKTGKTQGELSEETIISKLFDDEGLTPSQVKVFDKSSTSNEELVDIFSQQTGSNWKYSPSTDNFTTTLPDGTPVVLTRANSQEYYFALPGQPAKLIDKSAIKANYEAAVVSSLPDSFHQQFKDPKIHKGYIVAKELDGDQMWMIHNRYGELLPGSPKFNTRLEARRSIDKMLNLGISPTATKGITRTIAKVGHQLPDDFLEQTTKVAGQQGSNPGGWYETADGTRYYVKFQDDPTKARGEFLANEIYNRYGLTNLGFSASDSKPAVETFLFNTNEAPGGVGFASKDITPLGWEGVKSIDDVTPEQARTFLRNAHIDLLLGNWDVISYNFTNVMVRGYTDIKRIDQGGSFLHKAMVGRKPEHILSEVITDWHKFPTSRGYREMMEKAGISTFDDLGSEFMNSVAALPDEWSSTVNSLLPNFEGPDKDAIVKMLNARTKILKERARQIPENLLDRKLDEALELPNGVDNFNEEMPNWQKYLKMETLDGYNDAGDRDLLELYMQRVADDQPEIESLRHVLRAWFSSSKQVKYHMSQLLGVDTHRYKPSHGTVSGTHYTEGSRELVRAIARETPTAPYIMRGRHVDTNDIPWIDNMQVGDVFAYLPSSFSTQKSTAHGFMSGARNLRIDILEESKSLRARNLSGHKEEEWISGGLLEVVEIKHTKRKSNGEDMIIWVVKQRRTFNETDFVK